MSRQSSEAPCIIYSSNRVRCTIVGFNEDMFMRRFETNSTLAIALTILTIAGLLPLYIGLDRTPLPWADEVEFASTAISVRNGNPAIPSVLSGFPQTGRFDLFYGPVGIRLGATWMTLFGVNMWSWRSLSFAGGILVIVFSALLAYSLGAIGNASC